jgi:uncharacterized protein
MGFADSLLALLAFVGHFACCVATFNRLHAYGIDRRLRRKLELLLLGWFVSMVVVYTGCLLSGYSLVRSWGNLESTGWFLIYPLWCWLMLLLAIPMWLWPRLVQRKPKCVVEHARSLENVAEKIGPLFTHGGEANFLAKFPGNQLYHLQIEQKTLRIPRLPAALHGFSMTHLSDLHFTGDLDQRYYDYVVDAANQLSSDVVVISGDIIEAVSCEPWIAETLGRLTAPQGKYYVLGNHDRRMPDCSRVRSLMAAAGFIDVGGQTKNLVWNEQSVFIAGDERPWFAGPDFPEQLLRNSQELFSLLIAHSPDRYPWAQERGFALMLAGHNHGGQVRFPLLGPLISPSKWGTRYASGLFEENGTVLHVSRGISGEHPLRWNCPPELTKLILHTG